MHFSIFIKKSKKLILTKNQFSKFFTKTSLLASKPNIPHNKMFDNIIRVRFDEKEQRALISLKCKMPNESVKDFNLSRALDEEIASTFQKLYANYTKSKIDTLKSNKKIKMEDSNINEGSENLQELNLDNDHLPLSLHDLDNNQLPLTTKNRDAWQEDFVFKFREHSYKVNVNLPSFKKIALPKLMIAGMPTLVKVELDSKDNNMLLSNSTFKWFKSETRHKLEEPEIGKDEKKKKVKIPNLHSIKWQLISEGMNNKFCVLDLDCAERYVKVECIPSDGKRRGMAVEVVSNSTVRNQLQIENMPMTASHEITRERLNSNK